MRHEKEKCHCAEEKKENRHCRVEKSEIGENCATVESGYARNRIRLGIGQSMTYLRCLQTGLPRHPAFTIGVARSGLLAATNIRSMAEILRSTNEVEVLHVRKEGEKFYKLKTSRENRAIKRILEKFPY